MFHEKQFQVETFYLCGMNRKKWTPKTDVTESLLKFREKRKWQIALRRYVLERKWASSYAPYFGLDVEKFRKWIELQFDGENSWESFSKNWQFDHIVPVAYFDFNQETDLKLCWNFINIRVEKLDLNKNRGNRVDVLAAKAYFEGLYKNTGYSVCGDMIKKIEEIEVAEIRSSKNLEEFMIEYEQYIKVISSFSVYEYSRLNEGVEVSKVLEERDFLNKLQ